MTALHHILSYDKTFSLNRDFQELSKAAEKHLGEAGFMVVHESPSSLTLTGPAFYEPTQILGSFSEITLKERGDRVVVSAQFRNDDPKARFRKNAFMGLIALSNIFGFVLFFSEIPSSRPELIPAIMIPVVIVGLVAAFKLRPRHPDNAPEAKRALDQLLTDLAEPSKSSGGNM